MIVKADPLKLRDLSEALFTPSPTSRTKRLFGVTIDGIDGYSTISDEIVAQIDFPYTEVQEIPTPPENTISINGTRYEVWWLLDNMTYLKREPVYYLGILNGAVDVYFSYDGKTGGVRFQDWNIFRTLSDEQCLRKLQEYLIKRDVFVNSAAELS